MAKYILGNALRRKAQHHSWLNRTLWMLDYLLVGLLYLLLRALPVQQASRVGNWLGRRLAPMMKNRSDHIRRNLTLALPEKSSDQIEQLIPAIWGNAGAVLAEYPHLPWLVDSRSQRLKVVIREPIPTYTDPSRPAIFVTAHLANWEVAAAAISRFEIPFMSLYTPPANPWLDRLLCQSRGALGCQLLSRDSNIRPIVKAIGEGRSLAMVMDRRNDGGLDTPFFGAPKPSSSLAARLALRFDCPLVPVQVERLGPARFRVTFHPPLRAAEANDNQDARVKDLNRQIHCHFEQWIREAPQHWFCSKKVWPKDILSVQAGLSRPAAENQEIDR